MRVCYFGIYKSEYNRNRVLIRGLKKNNVSIIECNSRKQGIRKYFDLAKKYFQIEERIDCIVVGFPAQQSTIFAKLISRKPVIFDALVSLYDSVVLDRKAVEKNSLRAAYFWFIDWVACSLADKIVVDTFAHRDYFIDEFGAKKDKITRIFMGADDEVMQPIDSDENLSDFLVHFHGYFNPLQGVRNIVKAAKLLENEGINFNIVGNGKDEEEIKKLAHDLKLNNINFRDSVPYEKLPELMSKAQVCLGVFGETPKAKRPIPNKVLEALACRKPVITGHSSAVSEILEDNESVIFCNMSDPESLANKILLLKENSKLRERVAENGYEVFKNKLKPDKLGKNLKRLINSLI